MTSIPPSRRDLLKGAVAIAAASAATIRGPHRAHGQGGAMPGRTRIDGVLRQATEAKRGPGRRRHGRDRQGHFLRRRLRHARSRKGPGHDPRHVFRIASMTKAITSVAAMQLVEQGKLQARRSRAHIDPALGSPQVLEGFDACGRAQAPPRQAADHPAPSADPHRGLQLRDLGRDHRALRQGRPARRRATGKLASIRMPLVFDPGDAGSTASTSIGSAALVEVDQRAAARRLLPRARSSRRSA